MEKTEVDASVFYESSKIFSNYNFGKTIDCCF
jgi:hypothetical protein